MPQDEWLADTERRTRLRNDKKAPEDDQIRVDLVAKWEESWTNQGGKSSSLPMARLVIWGIDIKEVSTKVELLTGGKLLLFLSSSLNLPSPSKMMDARLQSDGTLRWKGIHYLESLCRSSLRHYTVLQLTILSDSPWWGHWHRALIYRHQEHLSWLSWSSYVNIMWWSW